ncbi:hypothetical protein HJG60_011307 [Phyllostomus discolor]|uniref:Uncharacterized protein n=1 Tax=Phyllostomus discolor TaxID=89673 RepID=A0A834E5A7_9CHIR|nr:hypothetical protein HJG60_011307 [Phyllostomus discolor]
MLCFDCCVCTLELMCVPLQPGRESQPAEPRHLYPFSSLSLSTASPTFFSLQMCVSPTQIPPVPNNLSTSRCFPFLSPPHPQPDRMSVLLKSKAHRLISRLLTCAGRLLYMVNVSQKRLGVGHLLISHKNITWKLLYLYVSLSFSSWSTFSQWVSNSCPAGPGRVHLNPDSALLVSTCLRVGLGGFLRLHTCHLLVTQNQNITALVTLPEAVRPYFKTGDPLKCN